MLREHTSELTKEFNKLREQLEDSDLKRELDLLPDNINKNKRLLYYLSQSDSFPEVILQKIEQAYKKVKILNNLDNVRMNTLKHTPIKEQKLLYIQMKIYLKKWE